MLNRKGQIYALRELLLFSIIFSFILGIFHTIAVPIRKNIIENFEIKNSQLLLEYIKQNILFADLILEDVDKCNLTISLAEKNPIKSSFYIRRAGNLLCITLLRYGETICSEIYWNTKLRYVNIENLGTYFFKANLYLYKNKTICYIDIKGG